jgi:hypothetical protein
MDENSGYQRGLVLNGRKLNKDPSFPSLVHFPQIVVHWKKLVVNPSLECVRARAYDLFKIHHPFSQAALVTEGIGNDVVTNNHRFAELLRSTSPHAQGCTNSYLVIWWIFDRASRYRIEILQPTWCTIFFIQQYHIICSSTCFERHSAHPQEDIVYMQYLVFSRSLCCHKWHRLRADCCAVRS